MEDIKPQFQSGALSEVLIIVNLRHAREQDLNLPETWVQAFLNDVVQYW